MSRWCRGVLEMTQVRHDENLARDDHAGGANAHSRMAPPAAHNDIKSASAQSPRSDQRAIQLGLFILAIVFVWMAAVALQRPITYSELADTAPWPDMRININTATVAELTVLPQIGPRLAERIVEDRERNGMFDSLDDLTRVHMIGPRTVETIRAYVMVKPVDAGMSQGIGELE
jgi:competence ComEA-like helix-hairpin-helix protein